MFRKEKDERRGTEGGGREERTQIIKRKGKGERSKKMRKRRSGKKRQKEGERKEDRGRQVVGRGQGETLLSPVAISPGGGSRSTRRNVRRRRWILMARLVDARQELVREPSAWPYKGPGSWFLEIIQFVTGGNSSNCQD